MKKLKKGLDKAYKKIEKLEVENFFIENIRGLLTREEKIRIIKDSKFQDDMYKRCVE